MRGKSKRLSRKMGRRWERRKIGQVERDRGPGERGWRRRRRKKGELLEPGRGHGVPVERNSGKHP